MRMEKKKVSVSHLPGKNGSIAIPNTRVQEGFFSISNFKGKREKKKKSYDINPDPARGKKSREASQGWRGPNSKDP